MNVRVHIERLVLDGLPLPPGHGALVRAAVEAELARLLAGGGVARGLLAGGAVPAVPAAHVAVDGAGEPGQVGRQIAQAVYGGIGR